MDELTTTELEQLHGQRGRLLARIRVARLAHSGMRLVLYNGTPLGIVQKRFGSMMWISPRRHYFYSLSDAAIDTVGWCWNAYERGGMQALQKLIGEATKQAGNLAEVLQEEPEPIWA